MASTYNNEPQPTAKVLLQTTGGDVLLELFAKQTPLASRNFLQLCLDGYYDNTIFHRLVPNFVLQGGDPTGTGSGGESIYENGKPFEDEFSNRLKFNRRGLLGMANTGRPNDNGSQFFLTLGPTPELTGTNTMFGRVVGDTIYNLVRMAEGEVAEGSDRPLFPEKITRTEVLVNPFEDMVKRVLTQRAPVQAQPAKKVKKKVVKVSLNMDGDDDDGLSLGPPVKKLKVNPKFAEPEMKPAARTAETVKPPARSAPIRPTSPLPVSNATSQLKTSPPQRTVEPSAITKSRNQQRRQRSSSVSSTSSTSSTDLAAAKKRKDTVASTNAQIDALKAAMKRSGPTVTTQKDKPRSALEAFIPVTSTRGRKRGGAGSGRAGAALSAAEQKSLDMFNAFKSRLQATSTVEDDVEETPKQDRASTRDAPRAVADDEADTEATLCDLHFVPNCQSCSKWDEMVNEDDGADVGEGWMAHTLSFAKDRLGKDLEWKRKNEEELVVIDPREKEREYGLQKKGRDRGKVASAGRQR